MRFEGVGAKTRQGSRVAAFNLPTDADGRRTPREQTLIQMKGGVRSIRGTGPLGCKPREIYRIQGVNPSDVHLSPALAGRCGADGAAGTLKETQRHLTDAETDVGVGV